MPGRRACFKCFVTNSFGCTVFHVTKKISALYSIVENTSYQLINVYLSNFVKHLCNVLFNKNKSKKIFEFL